MNALLAANFETDDQECTQEKQQIIEQCCDVSSTIVSMAAPTPSNPTQPTALVQTPNGNFTWITSGGQVHSVLPGIIFGLSVIFFMIV